MSLLLSLSHELLHCIFSELESSDLAALSRSCRALHSYIRGNRLLHRDVYLRLFDEPSHHEVDWESALHRVGELQKILENDRTVATKSEHLEKVADGIDWLLRTCTPGAIRSHNIMHLHYWFDMKDNVDAFLCNSSLFERVRNETRSSKRTPAQRQTSARLHCLFGVPIEHVAHRPDLEAIDSPTSSPSSRTRSRTRLACPHSYARSKVYDLREYTDKTLWGPFMSDGSHRVDWEKVEAIMIDIGFNLNKITERSSGRLGRIWGEPWEDAAPNSYISPPAIVDSESIYDAEVLKLREMALALDAQDPYGVSGSWMRVVCFLDYNDLYAFNFSPGLRDDDPREPINTEEGVILLKESLQVTRIVPPGSGDKDGEDDGLDWSNFTGERLPVVYFCGTSRSMHASWDPNANSRIRGSVRQTPEGEIRWTTFSIFHGEEKWRSEGIQVGGLRSARGVLGNWFDKDFDEHGPAGPTAFWKVTDHFDDEKPFLMPSTFL